MVSLEIWDINESTQNSLNINSINDAYIVQRTKLLLSRIYSLIKKSIRRQVNGKLPDMLWMKIERPRELKRNNDNFDCLRRNFLFFFKFLSHTNICRVCLCFWIAYHDASPVFLFYRQPCRMYIHSALISISYW